MTDIVVAAAVLLRLLFVARAVLAELAAPAVLVAAVAVASLAVAVPAFAPALGVQRHFGRHAFDHRLRACAMVDGRCLRFRATLELLVEFVVELVVAVLGVLDRHLRLCGGDDAVVVLGVLEIVLRHDPIARTHRIAGKSCIFLGDLLGGAADLHVRPVALVVAVERIRPSAVVVVVIFAAAAITTAHAPVLLLWPHPTLFSVGSSKNPSARRRSFSLPFRCPTGARPHRLRWRHVPSRSGYITCRMIPARS